MSVIIGKRVISVNSKPYFIADIAANHDGDINRAYKLIELAKESGADAAKFQNFKAKTIVSRNGFETLRTQLSHQSSWEKSVFETYQDVSLPDEWSNKLKSKCDEIGIEYMTSPYDFLSVDWADKFVNAFKIGSGDITWIEIIEHIAKKKKPVLLATGASEMSEVIRAVSAIEKYNSQIVLMQCNTNYTASTDNYSYINLNVLKEYKKRFPECILGLSDHTNSHTTVLGALALGARVFEKHFTDDKKRKGPDHGFSVEPEEWKKMVKATNELYQALGDGIKRVEDNEQETVRIQRRGLYLLRDLKVGDVITEDSVFPLRPVKGGMVPPYEKEKVIGKKVNKNLHADEALLWEDLESV